MWFSCGITPEQHKLVSQRLATVDITLVYCLVLLGLPLLCRENLQINVRGKRTKLISNSFFFQKPYACQVSGCGKRYTDPSSLRKHLKNHSENSGTLSSLLSSSDKISVPAATNNSATVHGLNSTISRQDMKTNYPSYELPKTYVKEEDTLSNNMHQLTRIPMNFDCNQQEYVPIESVCHLLINDVHSVHNESAGNNEYTRLIESSTSSAKSLWAFNPLRLVLNAVNHLRSL